MICKMCGREVKGAFAPGWVSVGKGGYGRVCPDCVEELGGTAMRGKKEGESEDLRRCAICRKDVPFIHPGELVINVDGKVVCPVCEKKVAKLHETAEEHRKSTGHTKEETAKEYIERVDRERREKEFEEVIERLHNERKEKELRERSAKVAEATIKFALGTHEALRGKCSCCGKAVHPSLITRVHGKYGCGTHKLCPDCYEDYRRDKAEEAAQIKMADLSIENNRLRTGLKDLEEEYESFRERTSRVWWGVAIAGVLIGSLFTLMFLNPKNNYE